MNFIDTHTHIYIEEFDSDYKEMMERAKAAGVEKMFLPSIDSTYTEAMMKLESDDIHLMMGLHPCSVKPDTVQEELEKIENWLSIRSFYAIGEIGIDLHWDQSTYDIQVEAFERQIDWAIQYDLPIVIHSRNSTPEVITVLERKQHPKLRGIFHCFGGSPDEAIAIIELGFKLGIGGVVTFKNAGLDKTVENIDLKDIVLETDAPYLSPAPFRGKRNEPAYLKLIAQKISDIKNVPIEDVARLTSDNAKEVFTF